MGGNPESMNTVRSSARFRRSFRYALVVLVVSVIGNFGCASTEADRNTDRTPRRVTEMRDGSVDGPRGFTPAGSDAKTIQLHRKGDETSVPIVQLRSNEQLQLDFDLIGSDGRPLSVYFYHADRDWRRDLSPTEYLDSFQRDDILNYTPSRATEVDYVHYQYNFPNESIRFLISGNYVLRVTEQGREGDIVFERPFFVTEQQTNVQMALEGVILSGYPSTGTQPYALFTPTTSTQATPFNYSVCFARNGALDALRCTDQVSLMNQPALEFYLPPAAAFEPIGSAYFLDLTAIRHSNKIEQIDMTQSPFELGLQPDLGRLGAEGFGPLLNGQVVVSQVNHDVADPDLAGQYVNVNFNFVPEGNRRYASDVFVIGSFNNWQRSQANKLVWVPENLRYEGKLLIKQGQYDYRYESSNAEITRRLSNGVPRLDNTYAAFVYYDDIALQTDRLFSVGSTTR